MCRLYYFLIIILFFLIGFTIYIKYYQKLKIYRFNSGKKGIHLLFIGGVHGNEPSGKKGLYKLIYYLHKTKLKNGSVTIIPNCNPMGGCIGIRYQFSLLNPDLNRNFNNKNDYTVKQIIQEVDKADIIVDFHEGWGFHLKNNKSLGSTLSPTNNKITLDLTDFVKYNINKTINEKNKKFVILKNRSSDITGTLGNYCNKINKAYLLVEISGQYFAQPMKLRLKQVNIIINSILSYLKIY